MPGGRLMMRYWPDPSVTTVRIFSISAGLAASTVTPGNNAPEASFAAPAIVPSTCANTDDATKSSAAAQSIPLYSLFIDLPLSKFSTRFIALRCLRGG